ncbi:signal transduction protein [Thermosulfidibacter takaii ABI70S6]|uniref:diguanylate cyclase n=2 Tax=Thermosulfidibacter takaii TaxID=412593 RepID=A0A0S3QT25_THET7|nr:signal transduction protein [Thermosulfidibacter takaii ABI70S6]
MELQALKVRVLKRLFALAIPALLILSVYNFTKSLYELAWAEIILSLILILAIYIIDQKYKLAVWLVVVSSSIMMIFAIRTQVVLDKWNIAVWMPVYVLGIAIMTDYLVGAMSAVYVVLLTAYFVFRTGKYAIVEVIFYLIQLVIALALTAVFYFAFYEMWRRYEALLRERGDIDYLTGALTRRRVMELLDLEIEKAKRGGLVFSIIMLDLDGFKQINDTKGHVYGDRVLQDVAKAIKKVIRKSDYFGRYGGDEFIIVAPLTDVEGAKALASRLQEAIKKVGVGASVGIAQYSPGMDVEKLIQVADRALYVAKRSLDPKIVVGEAQELSSANA